MKTTRFVILSLGTFGVLGGLYLWAYGIALRQPLSPHDALRNVHLAKDQLAAASPSPRWLIVGGSSAWFGFQSALIEEATGQPVANLGTHAEMPIGFQLWQAERHLRPGDTVLLAAEMVHFWRERPTTYGAVRMGLLEPGYFWAASARRKLQQVAAVPPVRIAAGLAAWLAHNSPAYGRHLALPPAGRLMENLRARWAGEFTGEVPGYYNYLHLDRHGDYALPRRTAPHPHDDYHLRTPLPGDLTAWEELAAFARRMQTTGVRCLFTWQPFERHSGVDFDAPLTRANFAGLRHRLTAAGWREVGRPEDVIMESEFFYDTPYHLTTEGARRRTVRLVERLREAGLVR